MIDARVYDACCARLFLFLQSLSGDRGWLWRRDFGRDAGRTFMFAGGTSAGLRRVRPSEETLDTKVVKMMLFGVPDTNLKTVLFNLCWFWFFQGFLLSEERTDRCFRVSRLRSCCFDS